MKRLDVGIDLDGVGYDFGFALWEYLVGIGRLFGPYQPPQSWEFYLEWGLTKGEFHKYMQEGIAAGHIFRVGGITDGFVEVLAKLRKKGHRIHIITARSSRQGGSAEENTRAWLEDHAVEYDSLTFSHLKTIVRTDVMIDDHLPNILDLRSVGTHAVLMNQAWNAGYTHLPRVHSMHEFADSVVVPIAKGRTA